MEISVDRNVVEFKPGNARETAAMELLWRVIVDCLRENKKLVPIGEYIPTKENLARFVIEGIPGAKPCGRTRKPRRTTPITVPCATST